MLFRILRLFTLVGLLGMSTNVFSQFDVAVSKLITPVNSTCSYSANETITAQFRSMQGTATNFTATVSINGSIASSQTFTGSIAQGFTSNYSFPGTFNFVTNGIYTIQIVVSSPQDLNTANDTMNFVINSGAIQPPYYENFETHNGGWYPGGTQASWEYGTPNKVGPPSGIITGAGEGNKCWVNGGLTGFYNAGENSYLYSPCFDFSNMQNPEISFKFIVETEPNWEKVDFQYSINNGSSWLNLGNSAAPQNCNKTNWYNTANSWSGRLNSSCYGSGCTNASYCGSWTNARHCLSGSGAPNLAGQPNVRFRFRFNSGTQCQDEGFGVDSIVIKEADSNADFVLQSCVNGVVRFVNTSVCTSNESWSFGDGTTTNQANPTHSYSPGTYQVTLISSGVCNATDTVTKTITIPNLNTPSDTFSCSGGPIYISADSGLAGYQWSTSATDTLHQVSINSSGIYSVTVSDSVCSKIGTFNVGLFSNNFSTNVYAEDTAICVGQTVNLQVINPENGTTYTWQNGTTGTSFNADTPGIYWVESANQCFTNRDSIELIVDIPPTINMNNDTTVCDGEIIQVSPGNISNANYLWSTGETTNTILVSVQGSYAVTVNVGGCSVQDIFNLQTLPSPHIDLGNDTTYCAGEKQALLVADLGNDQYNWSTGETTNFIVVNASGTYVVTATLSNCSQSDTIEVGFGNELEADIDSLYEICSNQEVTIGPFQYVSQYQWSNGSTDSIFTSTSSGEYSVKLTNICGEINQNFKILATESPELTHLNDTVLCLGDTISFSTETNAFSEQINWNTGDTTRTIWVTQEGDYSVSASNKCGNNTASFTVSQVTGVDPINLYDIVSCQVESKTVSAENLGAEYFWNTGETSQEIILKQTGFYTVDISRCNETQSFSFNYNLINLGSNNLFPNVITPNGDGYNDEFKPMFINSENGLNPNEISHFELSIHDRWGKEVFYTTNIDDPWNGRSKSGDLNDGTYFYTVKITSACGSQEQQGSVMVLK